MLIPKENINTCFICGRKAVSVEHVFPKWLQRRYNLWDEQIVLPNGTSVQYRKLLVPSCKKCNNDIYGLLEKKVSSGNSSESDIWKWANKIHYALCYKDRFFEWDRKNPRYKIGDVLRQNNPLEKDRHFLHCVSGSFKTTPDPFGSVFKFNFDKKVAFAFAHLLQTSSISITLGNIGYIVFITDGQSLKKESGINQLFKNLPTPHKREDMLFFHAQCIEMMARHKLGQNIIMSNNRISRSGPTVVHKAEPPDEERFRGICKTLGLNWIDSEKLIT